MGNFNTVCKTKEVNIFYLNEPIDSTSHQPKRLDTWSGDDIRNAIQFEEHLLPDRLVAGEITALYGEPKVGKTYLAISCGLMAAIGGEFWNEKFPTGGYRVIYVAAERREQAAIRIKAACLAMGLESIPDNFTLVEGKSGLKLGDKGAMAELRHLVRTINPEVMIFDTYTRMVDNDEDKAADTDSNIGFLLSLIRESSVPCAGILVHHAGKEARKKMRGSSALLAAVTSVWKVGRLKSTGVITLSMDDANSFAPPEPCHFTIETFQIPGNTSFDDFQKVGVAIPVEGPLKSRERGSRIIAIFALQPVRDWSIDDLVDALFESGEAISKASVDRVLQSLVKSGEIERRRVSKAYAYRLTIRN